MPVVQDAFDDLSLAEALDAFRLREGLAVKTAAARPEALIHLDRHDVAHVLLGLSTELRHEAMVDLWTLFGTDARWKDMTAYLGLAEELEIIKQIGWAGMIGSALRAVWDMPGVIFRTRRQSKKWPWRDYQAELGERVGDLRASYGVPQLWRRTARTNLARLLMPGQITFNSKDGNRP